MFALLWGFCYFHWNVMLFILAHAPFIFPCIHENLETFRFIGFIFLMFLFLRAIPVFVFIKVRLQHNGVFLPFANFHKFLFQTCDAFQFDQQITASVLNIIKSHSSIEDVS